MTEQTVASARDTASPGTSTLDLGLRIVEFLVREERPAPLGKIAGTLSASKATVYRHLQTLVRHGFARRCAERGSYQPGVKLLVLGEASRRSFDVVPLARDELTELGKSTGQTASVAALVDHELVVLDIVQGHSVVEFGTRPGTRLGTHASALGKVWLAFGPEDERARVLSAPLKPWTSNTIVETTTLEREVAQVKKRGWATAPNETIIGINTIAAPVFNHRAELVASLGITGSIQFIEPTPKRALIEAVVAAAKRVSRRLQSGS
ncbi:MAG: IclR family transcriptional regulator [Pseudorhodoplanes sp.]|uniref:IclR family transcriptional regulator n=1 Tax=Pseudorhodoplanes sp. TaxID=1934341 RepID=UPI003D111325